MAFPASPSNNDVHKEGNRAFVYDSALDVWDQVRETNRTENKILQGEIGSGVTFPSGHVIKMSTFSRIDGASIQQTGTNTWTDTGLEISHVTAESSTNSYLIWDLFVGMFNLAEDTNGRINVTMRDVSNDTYAGGDALAKNANYGFTYWDNHVADQYKPYNGKIFCGLEPGMQVPNSKSTWAAGETLYFRLFMSVLTGSVNVVHSDSMVVMQVTEVAR